MKEQLINEIQRRMLPYLNNEQLMLLKDVLGKALCGIELSNNAVTSPSEDRNALEAFITAKRIEGCSEKTLSYYQKTIEAMTTNIGKNGTTDNNR